MTAPDEYARRIRRHPYGPEEITAGGITAWFHGPFTVLTFTDTDGSAVTVSATNDDSPAGLCLIDLFTAAASGQQHEFADPALLSVAGGTASTRRLTTHPTGKSTVLTLETTDRAIEAILDHADAMELAERTRQWALRPY